MSRQAIPCDELTAAGDPCKAYAVEGSTKCAAHLGRVGRKSALTPELRDQLLTMLRAGNYLNVACVAVGITRQTFQEWMTRGKSDEPKDAVFRELRVAVAEARAKGEARNVARIAAAAAENWQAAAWLLERQYPERWGRASVRTRDEAPPPAQPEDPERDAFAEVDELAAARRKRSSA
jgi:hypothetical protein